MKNTLKIDQLKVTNFRNLGNLEYSPNSGLNIIQGKNAQGKTNLLESIYMMTGNKSFRTNSDQDLLNYHATSFTIRSQYKYEHRNIIQLLSYNANSGKLIKLNNKKVNHSHDDLLKIVLFTPDDLYLIKGSPSKRRSFLDFVLKQITSDYNYYFNNFTKTLRKRNLMLKNEQTNNKSFKIVNDIYVENASKLIFLRLNFITLFDEMAGEIFKLLNDDDNHLKIRYALSFPVNSDKINLDILKNALYAQLEEKSGDELRRRSTVAGPHLDDLHIYLDNRIARTFASQGQQRNIAITMKLAELYTFKEIKGYYPIFLLDEVLAELDSEKRQLLIDELNRADYQSFLTSVNLDKLNLYNININAIIGGELT